LNSNSKGLLLYYQAPHLLYNYVYSIHYAEILNSDKSIVLDRRRVHFAFNPVHYCGSEYWKQHYYHAAWRFIAPLQGWIRKETNNML